MAYDTALVAAGCSRRVIAPVAGWRRIASGGNSVLFLAGYGVFAAGLVVAVVVCDHGSKHRAARLGANGLK